MWLGDYLTNRIGTVHFQGNKSTILNGMTSGGQIFSQSEMSVTIKTMKYNKIADERGVIAKYVTAL